MKTFTIVAGVNGVGKSSFIGAIQDKYPNLGTIINPDKIAKDLRLSDYKAGRQAIHMRKNCFQLGASFTQETTLSGYTIKDAMQEAKANGYRIRLFYIALDSAEESIERIANRVRRGGHFIPTAKVASRFATRWSSLAFVLPLCDEAEFYDNGNGFDCVGRFQNGELIVYKKNPPFWISELEDFLKHHYLRIP